jgi:hypothetical protein
MYGLYSRAAYDGARAVNISLPKVGGQNFAIF